MRGAALALLLMCLLVSGCFARAPAPKDAGIAAANATNVSRVEPPQGRSGSFAGFNETNATEKGSGGLDHRHDMWAGKERVTLVEGNFGLWRKGPPAPGATTTLRIPEKKLVWEGTGVVEVTLSKPERRACSNAYEMNPDGSTTRVCTDYRTGTRAPDAVGAKVHVFYKDAIAKDWKDAGEAVWGKPTAIAIKDPKETDMPHATGTLWAFEVRSQDAQDDTLTFDARVDLLRAPGEIPLWPGHPDLYAATHARVVLQKQATTQEDGTSSLSLSPSPPTPYVTPEKLVSYGTRSLLVYANVTSATTSDPLSKPTGFFLEFHNATGRANRTNADPAANATHLWAIRVTDAGMDSPYAGESRWGFLLRGDFEVQAGGTTVLGCTGLCAAYDIKYEITIIATDQALPEDAYAATA